MRIALIQMNPTIGDFSANSRKIIDGILWAKKNKADLVIFPELALCGYPPDDFLLMSDFIDRNGKVLEEVIEKTGGITAVIGTIRKNEGGEKGLANSAAIVQDKKLLGFQDKTLLPTYDVFDERRYFDPSKESVVWNLGTWKIGVTICEDLWEHAGNLHFVDYAHDPVMDFKGKGLDLLVNISASPFHMAKVKERFEVAKKPAKTLSCPVAFCNQVGGNDSLIFDGYSLVVSKEGTLQAVGKGFVEDCILVDTEEKTSATLHDDLVGDLWEALVLGIRDYFGKSGLKKACLGLSGGIDSAVTLALAKEALGKENVLAVMLPSRFSSAGSLKDATELVQNLGVKSWMLSIEGPFKALLELLEPRFEGRPFDVAEENMQARIRGMILMAISNKFGHVVLSTGNKSELATGYSTLYGDMVGGLGVLSDVTKGQVYALARHYNRKLELIPEAILTKEPSAELREHQKDSDSLPDYSIIDTVVEGYVENHLSPKEIAKRYKISVDVVEDLVRRIHRNEYKRRQAAPGLRVSRRAFSVGRRFPIVQKWVVE